MTSQLTSVPALGGSAIIIELSVTERSRSSRMLSTASLSRESTIDIRPEPTPRASLIQRMVWPAPASPPEKA
ncbi:MAG: hypothetical protein R3C16_04090 [Hyphomonadaceae bacterium]